MSQEIENNFEERKKDWDWAFGRCYSKVHISTD